MLWPVDRLAPTRRPDRRAQGSQRWHELLFVHWEVPEVLLRPHVHPRLSLDTFEGRCFLGLVAFTMQAVRPYHWLPPVPTAREFGEINLRTYVHLDGQEPGVWFSSLDAASSLAVLAARLIWRLPYFRSQVLSDSRSDQVTVTSRRLWPSPPAEPWSTTYEIGAPLAPAAPESLEFFLTERYQFYAPGRGGGLRRARVHHAPYPLYEARTTDVSDALVQAVGLPAGQRTADYWSPGVDVELFASEVCG